MHVVDRILNKTERPDMREAFRIPKLYRTLMTQCWSQDPRARPTFTQAISILKTLGRDPGLYLLEDVSL